MAAFRRDSGKAWINQKWTAVRDGLAVTSLKICLFGIMFGLFLVSTLAWSETLVFKSDRTPIYSGPGRRFRQLATSTRGQTVRVSQHIISGRDEDYYEILLTDHDQNRLGYIATSAEIVFPEATGGASVSEEDMKKYTSLALATRGVTSSLSALQDSFYFWTLGYDFYVAEALFLSVFGGEVLQPTTTATALGVSVGLEQSWRGRWSIVGEMGLAPAYTSSASGIFVASSNLFWIFFGRAGLKYSRNENASFAFGLSQVTSFSSDNAMAGWGPYLSLEVGL